ncbi:polyprenol monophosphomannose synthase [Candidatus Woesearchaeota archaeon]|nr:polyprenol monophosphomannose synthase [Candidatus Woesearchaeota archaeon]
MHTSSLPKSSVYASALPTACIVLPTYNEAQNITALLDAIFNEEQQHRKFHFRCYRLMVLVVDDSSPDGTADIVRGYQQKNPAVHLLLRTKKEGLGAAYIAGMLHALSALKPDVLFEMDADFSHNPCYLFPMLHQIDAGADMVIGSRYVIGGSIPEEWGIKRRLSSWTANRLATIILPKRIYDATGGYRAFRASLLKRIDFNALEVKGYVFQVSLLQAILNENATVQELPISFEDRKAGKSKLRMADITEFAKFIARQAMQPLLIRWGTKQSARTARRSITATKY